MGARRIVIWLTGVTILVVLALVLILQMRKPKQVSDQGYWPTKDWHTGTPEEQGLDSAKLAEGLLDIQKKNIKIDSLLIIRNGSVILDAYLNDPYDGTCPTIWLP